MPDFTSALYLGFRHPSSSLEPWQRLTSGAPAALREPRSSTEVATRLAQLVGAERATLAPSTLHLFSDLFVVLAGPRTSIHVDAHAYPIARWGVERAAARGVPAGVFAAHDPAALQRQVHATKRRPLVLADGYCPGCGPTPLREYAEIVRAYGGTLVVDDTQPLGVLGPDGGGSLRLYTLGVDGVVVGASLAKGFGVPVAVLTGDPLLVRRYERTAETRTHCSPPTAAVVRAADHALAENARVGTKLRARLTAAIEYFRAGATTAGFAPSGGIFPVQTVAAGAAAVALCDRLRARDVHTVLHDGKGLPPKLSFILTSLHEKADLELAVAALAPAYAETG